MDNKWLQRPITRFYVQLGGEFDSSADLDEASKRYATCLMDLIKETDPPFFESIVMLRLNRKFDFRLRDFAHPATGSEKMINVLALNDRSGALHAYVDYLISFVCTEGFEHGEFVHFQRHVRARRRLLQLVSMCTWMCNTLDLKLPITVHSKDLQSTFLGELRDFYLGNRERDASPAEMTYLESVAKPAFVQMRTKFAQRAQGNCYRFQATDFYTGKKISAAIGIDDYRFLDRYIRTTYLGYCEPISTELHN